jgi:hypothetical protein
VNFNRSRCRAQRRRRRRAAEERDSAPVKCARASRSQYLSKGHLNPSPAWTQSRTDAITAAKAREAAVWEAFEEQSLAHEVNCAAYYIARGPFRFSGSISWTLRADDPQRAATLTLHPLPSRSVEDLLKAGII